MSENTEGELPRTLEVLWGRSRQRARGPAQALSLERIVATAIDLADAEGMSALSMARLAERLGCATMSLYRHVANKDELQVFMLDAAPGPPPEFDTAPADWRAALSEWALGLLGVYHRHPWILRVAVDPPLDPGQLAWMDAGLRTLGGTALRPHDKMSVVLLVTHYVRGEAQISANPLRAAPTGRRPWGVRRDPRPSGGHRTVPRPGRGRRRRWPCRGRRPAGRLQVRSGVRPRRRGREGASRPGGEPIAPYGPVLPKPRPGAKQPEATERRTSGRGCFGGFSADARRAGSVTAAPRSSSPPTAVAGEAPRRRSGRRGDRPAADTTAGPLPEPGVWWQRERSISWPSRRCPRIA
ncbi:TetR/AcrR family transcriptional regulator [Streptosporangium lutulentum]